MIILWNKTKIVQKKINIFKIMLLTLFWRISKVPKMLKFKKIILNTCKIIGSVKYYFKEITLPQLLYINK